MRPAEPVSLVFADEATFHEGVPANFKSAIPGCQVSPFTKYVEFSPARHLFSHRRLSGLGSARGYLPIGLFGNPTNWYGADGLGTPPLSSVIPDLRRMLDAHPGLRLLLDYSWEAGLGEQFLSGLDAFLDDLGVDPARATLLVSNTGIEARSLAHGLARGRDAGGRCRTIGADLWLMYSGVELQRKHWHGSPEALVLDSEAEAGRAALRARKFLSFNRRPRAHRYLLAMMLVRLGLQGEGFVSMSSPGYQGDWSSEHGLVESIGRTMDPGIWSALEGVREALLGSLPWTIDIEMDRDSGLPEQYLYATQGRDLFTGSYCQLVTESYCTGEPGDVFVTEKTCRAIGNLQPALVLGHAGTMGRLRALGFEPHRFFDEEYDRRPQLGDRLSLVHRELERLRADSLGGVHDRYYAELPALQHNRRHLFDMPGRLAVQVARRLAEDLWLSAA